MSTFVGVGTPCAMRIVRFAPFAASSKLTSTCARMVVRRYRCEHIRTQDQTPDPQHRCLTDLALHRISA